MLSREAEIELSAFGVVAKVVVHQRNDFARSMLKGKSVLDVGPKGSASALEIQELWAYIKALLNKEKRYKRN